MINFSIINSIYPQVLTKIFTVGSSPKSSAYISDASVKHITVNNMYKFNDVIENLDKNQCLLFGVYKGSSVAAEKKIITRKNLEEIRVNWPEIADEFCSRTNEDFEYQEKGGILCLDYDPQDGQELLSTKDLRDILINVVPELKNVPMLIRHSTSSFIKNTETGEFLRGERGKKIYIPVEDASKIPEFGKIIFDKLWLKGYGFIQISKAGSLLVRTIVDASMWQPSRIDFCCGCVCEEPLEQTQPDPEFYNFDKPFLTSIKNISNQDKPKLKNLITTEKNEKKPEARKLGISYFRNKGYDNPEKIYDSLQQYILPLDFKLILSSGERVSVKEVMEYPIEYIGKTLYDPNEPEYNNNSQVAKILKKEDGTLFIHSFAHGGRDYKLPYKSQIDYYSNKLPDISDKVIDILKQTDRVFYCPISKDLIFIDYTDKWLKYNINKSNTGLLVDFIDTLMEFNTDKGSVLIPKTLLDYIIDKGCKFNPFNGFSEFPVIDKKLKWFNKVGYDIENGLFITDTLDINEMPTKEDILKAFELIWEPVSLYKFRNKEISNSIIMSCFLSLVTMPLLDTKPAVLFNSAVAGSGKTKLAQIFSVLSTGKENTGNFPYTEEEIEKRYVSCLKNNNKIMVWDNLKSGYELNSPYLCNNITAKNVNCRLLGKSEVIEVKNDGLHFFTGNNVNPSGDLFRRIFNVYIDSDMANPHNARFPFCPVEIVKENRKEILSAIITIFNGFRNEGCKRFNNNKVASFETWDKYVRQCVFFLDSVLENNMFGDAVEIFNVNKEESSYENGKKQILNGIYSEFKNKDFYSGMILDKISMGNGLLSEAFENCIDSKLNSKNITCKLLEFSNVMTNIFIDNKDVEVKLLPLHKKTQNRTWFKVVEKAKNVDAFYVS